MRPVALFLIGASLFLGACSSKQSAQASSTAAAPKALAISTAPAVLRQVSAGFEETGSFVADESSDIAPAVAGLVIATPVNVGDFVKQGQPICELDRRDAQLKLDQMRAQLDEATAAVRQAQSRIGLNASRTFDANLVPEVAAAKASYESAQAQARLAAADAKRYENLVTTGDVSRSAFEKARTQQETADAQANAARQQYEGALNAARQSYGAVETSQASLEGMRAQLAQAQKGVADTTIHAPFDGYISARPVAAGEHVAVTDKIATIVRVGTMKLQLQTPEQRSARASVGMAVVAHVSAFPDRDFMGKVSAINPSVDPNSRAFILEAHFNNPKAELRPGMFATARVLLPGLEDAVFVPRSAVMHDRTTDSNQVFVIENNVAHLRVVLTGETDAESIRILSGLTGRETVATNHQADLFDGAPVVVQ
ncbi:MAG TPA: efflux RND transporter periplasmic adaptor subunit [Bryobacteraceae bacterium]|jgi:multidrug efflux pump subunit AcrA (membrane-fusion protein)|nr:efflux RND transporter periplasmic adaptor subunit [Bryobacteraceae bacterium]